MTESLEIQPPVRGPAKAAIVQVETVNIDIADHGPKAYLPRRSSERTKAGLERARAEGKRIGRPQPPAVGVLRQVGQAAGGVGTGPARPGPIPGNRLGQGATVTPGGVWGTAGQ